METTTHACGICADYGCDACRITAAQRDVAERHEDAYHAARYAAALDEAARLAPVCEYCDSGRPVELDPHEHGWYGATCGEPECVGAHGAFLAAT